MSTDYDFFFDESFHDRKITAKQFARENFLDYYIGLFWGTRKSNIPAVTESLEKIEHTAKKQFTIQGDHAGNGIKRKAREINAITQIIHIISKPQIPIRNQYSVDWTYHESFDGLYNLLRDDLHINSNRVNIFIDNEINTIKAANATHRFKSVEELDSANNICIRLSDWLAGFVGRLLFSIEHDSAALEPNETELKNTAPAEFAKLRLLSDHWFDLSRDQFECYRRAHNVFIGKQMHYWTLMTCVSIDGVSKFSNMLKYFNSYESYEEFKKIPAKTHSEKYNHAVCVDLEHHYRQLV